MGIGLRALLVVIGGYGAVACGSAWTAGQHGGVGAARKSELREVSFPPPPHHVIRAAPDEPDGTKLLYLDGWRMQLRGEQAVLAEHVTIDSLQRSCRASSGWTHVSSRGHVYWSSTFLGNLKLLGKAPAGRILQCGPQLVTEGSPPQLWTEAGVQPLEYSTPVGRAYFQTPLQGSAWVFPDVWLNTSDGGKTFTPTKEPGARGLFEEVPDELPEIGVTALGLAVRAWLERAVKSGAGRVMEGLRLSDGTWVRTGGAGDERYAALRTPDGRVTTLAATRNCQFLAWGSQLLTRCEPAAPIDTVVVDAVYPKVWLSAPPRALRHVIADSEGRYLFAQSRLGDGEKERMLMRFDGKAWQLFPAIASEPLHARHGWLVLKEPLRVVSAEHPDQEPRLLPPKVQPDEIDLLAQSVVFVERDADQHKSELVELDLRSGNVTSRTPFPGVPGALAFSDTGLAVTMSEGGRDALQMIAGRKFGRLTLQADPAVRHPDAIACWSDGCSVGEVMAWSRVPDDREPLVIPTEGVPPFEPDIEHTRDVGFSMPDYECDTVSPPARPNEELRGFAKGSARLAQDDESLLPLAAIPTYGGQLDLAPGALTWHGQDRQGGFRGRAPASESLAKLVERLPKLRGDEPQLLPALVARHFVLLDNAATMDEQSHLLVVRDNGETEELVPLGAYDFNAVPLPDGRALVSANFEAYRDVMLLDLDGKPTQRRKFLQGVRYSDSLALRGDVPGVLFADEHAPVFYTLVSGSPGTPITLPKFRTTEPCRTPSPRDALTLLLPAIPRLTVAGLTAPSRFWISPTADLQNGEVAFVETTPSKPCLRKVLLDAPIATELTSGAPWLHGRMQGQTKSYSLICKAVPPIPPRDSLELLDLLSEEEAAKHPRPPEDE